MSKVGTGWRYWEASHLGYIDGWDGLHRERAEVSDLVVRFAGDGIEEQTLVHQYGVGWLKGWRERRKTAE